MSKNIYYKQCRLRKVEKDKITETVSWIPEQFAVVGKFLQLKDDDKWTNGWEVLSTSDRLIDSIVEKLSHNSHKIWKATSGPCPIGNK